MIESTPTESANFASHGDRSAGCCCSRNGGSGMTLASTDKRRRSSMRSTSPWNGFLAGRFLFGALICRLSPRRLSVHLGVFLLDHRPKALLSVAQWREYAQLLLPLLSWIMASEPTGDGWYAKIQEPDGKKRPQDFARPILGPPAHPKRKHAHTPAARVLGRDRQIPE